MNVRSFYCNQPSILHLFSFQGKIACGSNKIVQMSNCVMLLSTDWNIFVYINIIFKNFLFYFKSMMAQAILSILEIFCKYECLPSEVCHKSAF